MGLTGARLANFQRLLKPRHIAVVGGRDAVTVIGECDRIGYDGPVWPVNPKRDMIVGRRCYARVEDLPEAPDAVYLAVRRDQAIEVTGTLQRMGAGGVVCYAAGFAETGPEGAEAEAELVAAAGDMALVGPNCYGIVNFIDRVALWPFARGGGCPGYGAAIITQSGMLSSDLAMSQRSLPFAYLVSAGNQAGLQLEDFVSGLCREEPVRAIGLHIEGLRDIPAFEAAALEALEAGVPIVALKTGTSRIGRKLVESHTASLSGDNELYEALFDRLGIISVKSPAQFVETLKLLCVSGVPGGRRMAAFTCSGGGATMLADHAESLALEFPQPGTATRAALREVLPDTATVSNPLDYTTPIWGDAERVPAVMRALLAEGYDGALLVQDYPLPGLDADKASYLNDASSFCTAAAEAGVPAAVCATLPENLDRETRDRLVGRGVAPLQGLHEALNAFAGAAWHGERRRQIEARPPAPLCRVAMSDAPVSLDEHAGKQRLADAGVTTPDGLVCTEAEVGDTARRIGFPVAVKMLSRLLAHKTEAGAVVLNLGSAEDVRMAAVAIRERVAVHAPEALTDRFLVEAMVGPPVAELLFSVRADAQFGLAMTLASGGILTELAGDAVTLLLPASESDICRSVGRLKAAKLIDGYRGKAGADRQTLVGCLMRLADYALRNRHEVHQIEINPLLILPNGVCAVDALVSVAADAPDRHHWQDVAATAE